MAVLIVNILGITIVRMVPVIALKNYIIIIQVHFNVIYAIPHASNAMVLYQLIVLTAVILDLYYLKTIHVFVPQLIILKIRKRDNANYVSHYVKLALEIQILSANLVIVLIS